MNDPRDNFAALGLRLRLECGEQVKKLEWADDKAAALFVRFNLRVNFTTAGSRNAVVGEISKLFRAAERRGAKQEREACAILLESARKMAAGEYRRGCEDERRWCQSNNPIHAPEHPKRKASK